MLSAHLKDAEQVEHHVKAVDWRPGEEEDDADSNQDAAEHGCRISEWCRLSQ